MVLYPARSGWGTFRVVVPGGTELELRLRRTVGHAAHTPNNRHVKCTGVYRRQ